MDIVKTQDKVLIIEGSVAFRAAISAYLSANYTVLEATSIAEGIQKAQEHLPDVLLVDKKLLDTEGQEGMSRLKARILSSTAVILLSGQMNVDDAVAAIKSGATDFIPKPVDPNRLSQVIEQNLEQVRIKKRFHEFPSSIGARKEESPWCYSGTLENTSVTDLFQFLSFSKMTGTLEVNCGLLVTSVFFKNGEVISAGSSDPREYLGHFLVSRGILNENEMIGLMKKQDEDKVLLGKLIIQEGLAEERVVSEILIEKITDTVTNLFLQKKGVFTFYQNFIIPYMFHTVQVPVSGLILKGEVKSKQWEKMRSIVKDNDVTVEWTTTPSGPDDASSGTSRILLYVDGKHTIEDICLETHSSEWSVLSCLYPLYEQRLIRFVRAGEKSGMPGSGAILMEQMLEKSRRLLIAGNYEQALRMLYRACRMPDCDWRLTMPLLEDAESRFLSWFYAERMALSDVPYLRSSSPLKTLELEANEAFLFSRINGIRDVRALIHLSPMREIDVLLSLLRFQEYRLIGIRRSSGLDAQLEPFDRTGERPLFPMPHQAIEQMIRDLPLGVLITNQQGEITYANEYFMKISSLKKEQLEGMHYSTVLRDQKPEQLADGYERELLWAGPDGRSAVRSYWLYSVYPFTGTRPEESGATILVRDVTDLHRKELNDRRTDRLSSLGEFVAGMTHQLKNPVMLLETAVKWLLHEPASREEMLDAVRRMQKNVERIRNLISDTLNYVSMDESSHSWINLNDLIENSLPGLKEHVESRDIAIEFHPMQQPPLIRGNETQIREVLISLAVNAFQAMPAAQSGRLQITTDIQEELEGAVLRKYLLLVVSDTGPGMSPHVVEKIFTPFFTTRPGGKGLGLAFAKRIVEEQGGFIRCWSREGIGTHFYVYFRIGERNGFHLARG